MFHLPMLWRRHLKLHPTGRQRLVFSDEGFDAIYAITDIHGCAGELADAHARILEDASAVRGSKLIVYLGDYVDRGPASRKVLDMLAAPPLAGFERVTLSGNHDDEFARMARKPSMIGDWIDFAGTATLASYGIDVEHVTRMTGTRGLQKLAADLIPEAHIAMIDAMPVSLQIGQLLFVHAGIRPGVDMAKQTDMDMMWIREPFLSEGPGLPLFVIHGHTPVLEPTYGPQRIAIDTAACSTGHLTVLKIADANLSFV
jgi:serine/threonine protein phosphatase 1